MMLLRIALLAAGIGIAGCGCVSDAVVSAREAAVEAFRAGRYEEAFREFAGLGFSGDAISCCYLGVMYRDGLAVRRDPDRAFLCFLKAAEQEVPAAQYQLSLCFLEGRGAERDPAAFLEWTRKAAAQEYPAALVNLGACYLSGFQMEQDSGKGVELLARAAALGSNSARVRLAECRLQGVAAKPDWEEAVMLLQEAAAAGNARGSFLLGALVCCFPELEEAAGASGIDLLAAASNRGEPRAMLLAAVVLKSRGKEKLAGELFAHVRDRKLLAEPLRKRYGAEYAAFWKRVEKDDFADPSEKRTLFLRCFVDSPSPDSGV